MQWILSIILVLILMPRLVLASTADLSISASDISFSADTLIAGDQVRVYAQIVNVGDQDVAGYVSFFQGSIPLGDSQVISVRANGQKEDVYVDFLVPVGSFNIRAEIRGTDPPDTNADNDIAITSLFTPVYDEDRDGVVDEIDNCVHDINGDQLDSDNDGVGDVCDNDDDNDGLSDQSEIDLQTQTTEVDSDGDGVSDAIDAYPNDPNQQTLKLDEEPVVDSVTGENLTVGSVNQINELDNVGDVESSLTPEATVAEISSTDSDLPARRSLHVSPEAVFTYEQTAWNTYRFVAQTPTDPNYVFEWNFGDGVTSTRNEVDHVFHGYGEFIVTLRVTDPAGQVSHDAAPINVSFFNLHNRLVQSLIGILILVLIIAATVLTRSRSIVKT